MFPFVFFWLRISLIWIGLHSKAAIWAWVAIPCFGFVCFVFVSCFLLFRVRVGRRSRAAVWARVAIPCFGFVCFVFVSCFLSFRVRVGRRSRPGWPSPALDSSVSFFFLAFCHFKFGLGIIPKRPFGRGWPTPALRLSVFHFCFLLSIVSSLVVSDKKLTVHIRNEFRCSFLVSGIAFSLASVIVAAVLLQAVWFILICHGCCWVHLPRYEKMGFRRLCTIIYVNLGHAQQLVSH